VTNSYAMHTLRWPEGRELRWAALFAGVVMALTCLPYLYGLAIRPADAYYSGLLTNPDEHNVYLAYMKQASDGRLFLIDPFTSEYQQGRVVNVFFLALGRFSRATGISLPVTYQLARVLSGWLLLMAVYCLGAQVLASLVARRFVLMAAAFASGLGWLIQRAPGQPHPVDYGPGLIMPEVVTFLSLLLNPLFCFSMFLMITIVALGAHAFLSGSKRSALVGGLAALVLGNIHTYDLIPVGATLGAYLLTLLVRSRAAVRALTSAGVMAVIASPSVAYQLWLLRSGDVTLTIKTAETPVFSPPPIMLGLGLGIPLLLALLGVMRTFRPDAPGAARLLALWLVVGFAVAYAPVPFQRKLAQGVQIPMMILASFGIERLLTGLPRLSHIAGVAALLASMLPSNILFVNRTLRDLQTNNSAYIANLMPPLYLRSDQYDALQWLDEEADFGDVLLCNSFLGSYAPSLAGTRVYMGHWAETLHFHRKLSNFALFLDRMNPEESRREFVKEQGITYILRDESIYDEVFHLAPDGTKMVPYDLTQTEWLFPVFAKDEVTVYRVLDNDERNENAK